MLASARESEHVKNAESSAFEIATAEFHQALRTNDAEALFAYVADDVLLMPPGEVAVRGKNAMRDWYAGVPLSVQHLVVDSFRLRGVRRRSVGC
jgi:ketosteroid isomerase-like protein